MQSFGAHALSAPVLLALQAQDPREPWNAFAAWLQATPLSLAFQAQAPWLWPLCESLHFVGLALLVGVAGFVDVRLLGLIRAAAARGQHPHLGGNRGRPGRAGRAVETDAADAHADDQHRDRRGGVLPGPRSQRDEGPVTPRQHSLGLTQLTPERDGGLPRRSTRPRTHTHFLRP